MLSILVNLFFNLVLMVNASILTFSLYCFSVQIGRSKAAVLLLLIRCFNCGVLCLFHIFCTLLCVLSSFVNLIRVFLHDDALH